jgi:MFS transporter, SET family, sugar efflux transporter
MIARHPVWQDPSLRALAVLIVLFGAVVCSFGPYISLLAVRQFELGDDGYAVLLVVSTALSVSASIFVGIRADQTAGRRRIALITGALMLAGVLLMTLWPTRPSFVVAHALIFPLASTLFGQFFAQARIAAMAHPPAARDAILSTIRALFALPFVIVLPLWSVAFTAGAPILAVYPVCLILAVAMFALIWAHWPRDGGTGGDRPSGLSFRHALAELVHLPLALRVLALGAVSSGGTIYMALLGLVLTPDVGRSTSDVALYAGLCAGLEVPFMLAMPLVIGRMPRTRLILIGTAIYAIHVVGLPLLAESPLLWLLILPAAVGAAITLTLPIAYLQDLLANRPGTGASLLAMQKLLGDVIAAVCFVLGTALSGYALVAILGSVVAVAGAAALHLADGGQAKKPGPARSRS